MSFVHGTGLEQLTYMVQSYYSEHKPGSFWECWLGKCEQGSASPS